MWVGTCFGIHLLRILAIHLHFHFHVHLLRVGLLHKLLLLRAAMLHPLPPCPHRHHLHNNSIRQQCDMANGNCQSAMAKQRQTVLQTCELQYERVI